MDGILIINKPKQYTSHDIVAKIKKMTSTKVGHTGTLDPMATGVLPLLLGQATKLSKYLTQHDKIYEAKIQLGIQTDTADAEGTIIAEKDINKQNLTKQNIENILQTLVGVQKQIPPMYSAIKVKGKKLYEYARNNQTVEIPERTIEIYKIQLQDFDIQENTITYKVYCSKGTYIRTLCETIAEKLDTIGYMKELNRIQVGEFNIEQSITIEQIENNKSDEKFWSKHLITIPNFFENKPKIILEQSTLNLFLNGVLLTRKEEDGIYQIELENGTWVGIGIINKKMLKRELILI